MSEYDTKALRAELSETQSALRNLQGAVEQLTLHLQNHLFNEIADTAKQLSEILKAINSSLTEPKNDDH